MIEILSKLKVGDGSFPAKYKECVESWFEILEEADSISSEELAKRLTSHQSHIEIICHGERGIGKTVTAYSAFHYLYDDINGFEGRRPLAKKLLRAFEASFVSIEVKSYAAEAAETFCVEG